MQIDRTTINLFLTGTVFYNYIFILFQLGYNFYLRGLILNRSIGAVYGNGKSIVFGIAIFASVLCGTYAVFISSRILRSAGIKSARIPAFIIAVLNWVIVVFMILTAVKSFGIDISKQTDMLSDFENTVIVVSILSAMITGGVVFAFIARISIPYEKSVSMMSRISSGIAAFIFLCLSYTIVWETIVYNSVRKYGGYDITTGYGILGLTGWILSFILLYPPMRFSFILQEIHLTGSLKNFIRIAVSYLAVTAAAMLPLIKTGWQG